MGAHLISEHRLELGGEVVPRPAVEHRADQRGFERFGARAADVERDAAVRVAGLGALVAGERGGGVHRDAVPDVRDPVALHPVIEQQCPHEVGAAHLEPLVAVGGWGEADVVQHRAEVEHLVVELDAVGGGERRRELVAALAVGRDDRRALVEQPLHLGGERSGRWVDEITAHAVTAYEGNAVKLREPLTLPVSSRARQKIVPGLRMPFGSNAALMRRMSSTLAGSSSSRKYFRFVVPMPCSPEIAPPSAIPASNSACSSFDRSSGSGWKTERWMLPSPA